LYYYIMKYSNKQQNKKKRKGEGERKRGATKAPVVVRKMTLNVPFKVARLLAFGAKKKVPIKFETIPNFRPCESCQ
jgi:hypothetical protein